MDFQDKLKLEISNILNETGAYKQIEELLRNEYDVDLDIIIYEYDFENNLTNPIIDYYNEKHF